MTDTTPLDTTPDPTPEPRRRFPLRPILIGAAAGVVALGLGVGGFALAGAFDDDDRIVIASDDDTVPLGGDDSLRLCVVDDDDDDDETMSPEDYDKVTAAALAAAGGGTVTKVSRDDDPDKAWEVEIRRENGDEVEVELNADLEVVRTELDRPQVTVVNPDGSTDEVVVEVRDGDC